MTIEGDFLSLNPQSVYKLIINSLFKTMVKYSYFINYCQYNLFKFCRIESLLGHHTWSTLMNTKNSAMRSLKQRLHIM